MAVIELTLVFDTEDIDVEDEILTLAEINEYAEALNLDTARAMVGYQGWRVEEVEANIS